MNRSLQLALLAACACGLDVAEGTQALLVDFESQAAGAKAVATAVRPTTNLTPTGAPPASTTNPGPIGTIIAPYPDSPTLRAPGTGKFVRFYDYHSGSGAGLEWDFVADAAGQASAVRASFRFAFGPAPFDGGATRISLGRWAGSTALTLNSGANRPFLVTLRNNGLAQLELAGTTPQALEIDRAAAHLLTIIANDHETRTLRTTTPGGAPLDVSPNSVAVYVGDALVGTGPFDAATAAVFGTDANLGRFGFSTLTTEGGIDTLVDDVSVEILEAGGGGPLPPSPAAGFGRGTGDPSIVTPDPDVLLHDPFDAYPDGPLERVAARWRVQDGVPRLAVESGAVRYDFLGAPATGLYARNFTGGRTVLRVPTGTSPGPVAHYAYVLRVDDAPTSTTGGALVAFQSSTSATTIRGTTWVRAGTAPGTFQVGVASENSSTTVTWHAAEFPVGTPLRLAARIDLTTNAMALWVDPADASAAPVVTTAGTGTLLTGTNGLALRINTGTNLGRLRVDALRAALSLAGALAADPVPEASSELLRDSAGISVLGDGYDAYLSGNAQLGMFRAGGVLWVAAEGGRWVVPAGSATYLQEDSRLQGALQGRMQSNGELVTIHPSEGRLALLLQNNRDDVTLSYVVPVYVPAAGGVEDATGTQRSLPATLGGPAATDVVFPGALAGRLRAVGFDRLAPGAAEGSQDLVVDVPPRSVRRVLLDVSPIAVDAPRAWQVFQRSERAAGTARIAGRAPRGTTRATVEFLASAEAGGLLAPPLFGALPVGERELAVDAAGRFSGDVVLPAGGWYRAVIRARDGTGALLGERAVDPFGVGEVFVGAGQSNSTNSGSERQRSATGLVAAYSGGHWQPAADPLPGVHDTSSKGSYYPPLGDALARRFGVPVAFASTGHGGTSVAHWQENAPHAFTDFAVSIRQGLYSWTLHRLRDLGPGGFRAVLWHQGESDSTHVPGTIRTAEQDYYVRLMTLVEGLRDDAGFRHEWYLAKGTRWPLETDGDPQVRRAVERLVADGVGRAGADSDTLGLDLREPAVDATSSRVHFNGAGLVAHAGLWAAELAPDLDEAFHFVGAPDGDGGGLPDAWETLNGFDPANRDDDVRDEDGDGLANAREFLLGTNPRVRDAFALRPVAGSGADRLRLDIAAIPGRAYQLQQRSALTSGTWVDVGEPLVVPDARTLSPEWLLPPEADAFLRLEVIPR